jgi:trk system potassium uptake protein TrkA
MNIVVAGQNEMALRVAEALMRAHDVVSLRLEQGAAPGFESLDIESVFGAATSPSSLKLAHIQGADAFLSCTESDEQNIVSCLAARRLGAKRTICVLQSPGFLSVEGDEDLADSLGIDEVIRPGEQLAHEIVRIVSVPGALDVRTFEEGRVTLLRYAVRRGAPATAGPLKTLDLPKGALLVTVRRGEEMIVPRGATRLDEGDKVVAMGHPDALNRLTTLLGAEPTERRAAVVGGGSVGFAIARGLERAGWHVKLIEINRARCEKIAGELKSLVLNADGADLELLEQEHIGDMPVVVCVTNSDEKNLLVSLLAKTLGVPRIITRADRLSNERMFEKVGVDVVLSARGATVRSIVQTIDTSHAKIRAELEHGSTRVIELHLPADFETTQLMTLRPPQSAVVGFIARGKEHIIPQGSDELRAGDKLLVFCATEFESETRNFFLGDAEAADEG